MPSANTPSQRGPRGFSLVSLMVGITLALICAVAALHVYRTSVLNARLAATNARSGSVAAALALQTAKLLAQAGWGMGAGLSIPGGRINTDLVLLSGASANGGQLGGSTVAIGTTPQTGNALIWASALGGTIQCRALLLDAARGPELWGPQDCASAVAALAANWTQRTPLAATNVLTSPQFQVSMGTCWPFGGGLSRPGAQVQVTGTPYALPATCLPNIQS